MSRAPTSPACIPPSARRLVRTACALGLFLTAANLPAVPGEGHWISLHARIVEIDRQALKALDVEWQTLTDVGGRWYDNPRPQIGTVPDDAPRGDSSADAAIGALPECLRVLRESDKLRVVASPAALLRSGRTVDFLVGGPIPIPNTTFSGGKGGSEGFATRRVHFRSCGVEVAVVPRVIDSGSVNLVVVTDASLLDFEYALVITSTVIPAFRSRRGAAAVQAASGGTLVVRRLLTAHEVENHAKVPFVRDIPVFGSLYRSAAFRSGDTELAVLLTVRVVPEQQHTP